MSTARATIDAPLHDVWDALVDVRTYPRWLVGARRIRAVDDDWPIPGTAFHHVVGFGPLTIADSTRSREVDAPLRLVLDVRARPLVHAEVRFTLRPTDEGTEVLMEEHPVGAHQVLAPLLSPLALARNRASLKRLEERVAARKV